MKTKLLSLLLTFVLSFTAYGQIDVQLDTESGKRELSSESLKKGKVIENGIFFTQSFDEGTKKITADLSENGKLQVSKIFEINVEKEGNYFFAAHILPANDVEKISKKELKKENENEVSLLAVRVYVNEKFVGTLNITKFDWELTMLKEAKEIALLPGDNTIRFESDAPYYPMIDVIRITQSAKDLLVENKEYEDFITQLKANSSRNLSKEKESQEEIDKQGEKLFKADEVPSLRSAMLPNGNSGWQVSPTTLSNPLGNYKHMMQVPITYTYYRKLSLAKGSYTFLTQPIAGDTYYTVDPVMCLFKIDDPHNYSYYNDDDSGYGFQSRISVSNIPAGDYYLVVRAYSSYYATSSLGRQGLVNVYQNGVLLNSGVPVAGYMVDVSSSNTGILNYFTAYTKGIPLIWLQENSSKKLKFKGGTYWFVSPSDYYWFDDARMRLTKNSSETYSMLISAEGAMGFYFGNCDVYGSCIQGSKAYMSDAFPNLKDVDCIVSAPASSSYNCASWAGGRTDLGRFFWASKSADGNNLSSPWYVSGNYWKSWDNFFGNMGTNGTPTARFAGAPAYSRTPYYGESGDIAPEIALWTGDHASVRIYGNKQPHGYSWESKCGGMARIFHPQSAFSGSIYGSIFQYYYRVPSTTLKSSEMRDFTYEESLACGLTVIQNVQLSEKERKYLNDKTQVSLRAGSNDLYENKLKILVEKLETPEFQIISNPEYIYKTDEYQNFYKYCLEHKSEILPKLMLSSFSEDIIISEITSEIMVSISYNEYENLMNKVKTEWSNNCYTSEGAYIAPSIEANKKNYIKKIIGTELLENSTTAISPINNVSQANNSEIFEIYPNPVTSNTVIRFKLNENENLTVSLYDSSGNLVQCLVNDKYYNSGQYEIPLRINNLTKGIYICHLSAGETKLVRRLLIK